MNTNHATGEKCGRCRKPRSAHMRGPRGLECYSGEELCWLPDKSELPEHLKSRLPSYYMAEPDHLTEGEKAGISGKTLLGPPTVMCPDCGDGVLDGHGEDVQECPLCRWNSSSEERCTAERGATRCARQKGHTDAHRNGDAMWMNSAGVADEEGRCT